MGTDLVKNRPAETTAVAASAALLIARALGVDDVDVVTALAIVIGFIPALVTWIVVLVRNRGEGDAA